MTRKEKITRLDFVLEPLKSWVSWTSTWPVELHVESAEEADKLRVFLLSFLRENRDFKIFVTIKGEE
jgi:hypothetical protein